MADEGMFRLGMSYLAAANGMRMEAKRPGSAVSFPADRLGRATQLAGQSALELFASLEGTDGAGVSVTLRDLPNDDRGIVFDGILDNPNLPRRLWVPRKASKRKVNSNISTGDFIYLDSCTPEAVKKNEMVELDIMLRPAIVTVEKGRRLMVGSDGSRCPRLGDRADQCSLAHTVRAFSCSRRRFSVDSVE